VASEALLRLRDRVDYWTGRATEAIKSTKRLAPRDKRLDATISEYLADLEAYMKMERRHAEVTIKHLSPTRRAGP
jgi:hypothetical protein